MKKYSAFSLLRNALSYNRNWSEAWRSPDPQRKYDVLIVGGGGHGLATAYYLAKEHGVRNIAVLEKGWIGGGNTGRNTTIVRSNYLWTEASLLYEKSLKLWEGLSQDLNYNVMFSQRGVYNLGHTLQDMRDMSLPSRSARQSLTSILRRMRVTLSLALRCSDAPALRATTPLPGGSRVPPMRSASISSSSAR
jgi:heterotetrameric sarcosine oxidase beta subunit